MIAIPLNEQESTVISQLYGNAPFFAMLDLESGEFTVVKNGGLGDGEDTANFIINSGAKSTIFYHMGEGLYKRLHAKDIEVFSCGKVEVTLDEVFNGFLENSFKVVLESNSKALLDPGSCTCDKNK